MKPTIEAKIITGGIMFFLLVIIISMLMFLIEWSMKLS
jgi:hypothetical protein